MHRDFINGVVAAVESDASVEGLAIGGSWIENSIDEFSDIDLVLVTDQLVSDSFEKMYGYASRFGTLLNAFTGEHVGEKRLLICLYDEPLLHVDIKFVVLAEFGNRVEDPIIVWDRRGELKRVIESTTSGWPSLDYQWIEDRFWTWVHYGATKLGRGELFEAVDSLAFLRVTVLAPLLQIKNGRLPRGARRVEQTFPATDLARLAETVAQYSAVSIADAQEKSITLYRDLRAALFKDDVIVRSVAEKKCVDYFERIKRGMTGSEQRSA